MILAEIGSDGVGRLTLARPDSSNALTVEMRDELVATVRAWRIDPAVRAVLLSAEGRNFCSGMDLRASTVSSAGSPGFDPRSTGEALRVGVQALVRELWELDKPTVAAVNGIAVGPGAHLALSCDFVFVSPSTRLKWTFANWGLVVDTGGAYLLPRLVGLPRAKAMVLLGEEAAGEECVGLGLAYRCAPDGELLGAAEELAARLASGPTRALGLSKRLLNRTYETDLADSLELEAHFQSLATASSDLVEGMAAFGERRPPKFSGR